MPPTSTGPPNSGRATTTVSMYDSVTGPIVALDLRISRYVYETTQKHSVLKTAATVISLTTDEIVAFPATILLGFLFCAVSSPGSPVHEVGRHLLLLMGDFGALCLMEQAFKLLFRRNRPPYMPKKVRPDYAMPFEWWSFPSGHSWRAAYTAMLLLIPHRSPFFVVWNVEGATLDCLRAFFILWPIGVAVSRVALAKHFFADVVAGAAIGFVLALATEFPHQSTTGPLRLAMMAIFLAEAFVVVSVKKWRAAVPYWPSIFVIISSYIIGINTYI